MKFSYLLRLAKYFLRAAWYAFSGSFALLFWMLVAASILFTVGIISENKLAYDVLFSESVRRQHLAKVIIVVVGPAVLLFMARLYSFVRSTPVATDTTKGRKYEAAKSLQKAAVSAEVSKGVV